MTAFQTRNGRTVYDGGGIMPDIEVEQEEVSNLIISLVRERLFFDFATLYKFQNPSFSEDSIFAIPESGFSLFKEFLSDKSYDYKTETEKAFDVLKKKSENENYFTSIENEFNNLLSEFELNKKNDLDRNEIMINEILSEEIASRYAFQEGRIQTSILFDKDVAEAIKYLNNKNLYQSVLTAED